jgi:hypothetical protein
MMADPIFMDIPMECNLISIDELVARRNQLLETHRIEVKHSPREREDAGAFDDTGINNEAFDDQEHHYNAFDTDEDPMGTPESSDRFSRTLSVTSAVEPSQRTPSQNRTGGGRHHEITSDPLDPIEDPSSPGLRSEHSNHSPQNRSSSPTRSYS